MWVARLAHRRRVSCRMTGKCPHADVRYCPLYVESHNTRGLGCVDGHITPLGDCKVARGAGVYSEMVAKLEGVDARLVAQCRFLHDCEERRAQVRRNLAINHIH